MKKKILIGSILAVALLTLVSFSSVVGYSSVKSNPSNTIITDEYDSYTPIKLVFQLIAKLRNHPNIQNVETEDEILQIIEGDEALNSIYEELSAYGDCGCEDDTTPLEWKYPVICLLIFPLTWVALYLYFVGGFSWLSWLAEIVGVIGYTLDCFWFF